MKPQILMLWINLFAIFVIAFSQDQKNSSKLLPFLGPVKSFCHEGRMLPRVFIIGCMKCGTTSLYYDLNRLGKGEYRVGNPYMFEGSTKEKQFFDRDNRYLTDGIERYLKTFDEVRVS